MPSPEEIDSPKPTMYSGPDVLEFIKQKAGESLAQAGHGHRRQEAVRDIPPKFKLPSSLAGRLEQERMEHVQDLSHESISGPARIARVESVAEIDDMLDRSPEEPGS